MPSRLHTAFFLLVLLTRHDGFSVFYDPRSSSTSILSVEAAPKRRKDGNELSRNVAVHNKAAAKIDIFWIHPTTKELAPSNTNGEGIVFGAMTGVVSYVGHDFEVQEIPNPKTGKCKYAECRKAYFSCSREENQVIDIENDASGNFIVKIDDDKLKAGREARRVLEPCQLDPTIPDPHVRLEALAACWQAQADAKLAATKDDVAFEKLVRSQLGSKLQNYKCDAGFGDAVNVTTSSSLVNETYFAQSNKQAELLFESDYSSVRLYRDFLSATECKEILLGQAATASDTALQKIRRLVSEVLLRDPYKTSTKSIRLRVDGNANQECTMQADGSCLPHSNSDHGESSALMRVTQTEKTVDARLLVTCTNNVDVQGGVIFYPKAGVQIVPVSGEAVLTVYKDSRGRRDDDPYVDDHVVCPVRKGVVVTLEDTFYSHS